MPAHTCVTECAGNTGYIYIYIYHRRAPFLRMCLWWSLCTLYLLACQVRVNVGAQVFVVVFMCDVFRVLTPFVDSAQAFWASLCFKSQSGLDCKVHNSKNNPICAVLFSFLLFKKQIPKENNNKKLALKTPNIIYISRNCFWWYTDLLQTCIML